MSQKFDATTPRLLKNYNFRVKSGRGWLGPVGQPQAALGQLPERTGRALQVLGFAHQARRACFVAELHLHRLSQRLGLFIAVATCLDMA